MEVWTVILSGIAILISIGAIIVSIELPIHLAKRAEKIAKINEDKKNLPPFYRKVREFAVNFNTPGVGYYIEDVYHLSNDARELGLTIFKSKLDDLYQDLITFHSNDSDVDETLGLEIQRKLKGLYDISGFENDYLYIQAERL